MIDLHTHSNCSDGSDPPERIPELAAAAGCSTVALTDHDRLDGIERARRRAQEVGVRVIAGCELSCATEWGSAHVLAYFIEPGPGPLPDLLTRLQEWRAERNRRLAARLQEHGLPVTLEEIENEAGAGADSVGRPHVAAVLLRKGVVENLQEAYDAWLGKGRPAYVERRRLELAEAVELVRRSGGVAALAHPLSLGLDPPELDRAVAGMAAEGLAGVEAVYGRYDPDTRETLAALARRHHLVATGGSDFHGSYKPDLRIGVGQGDLAVADEVLDELDARRPPPSDPS